MCSALVSVYRLMNETGNIHAYRACFGSWIKERVIFMRSALGFRLMD